MSFKERIEQRVAATLQPGSKLCALAKIFQDTRLSTEDRSSLMEVVDVPKNDPRRVSSTNISLALREEGIDISRTAVDDHRRKACRCYSVGKDN
jgi:hypothetical protein